MEKRKKISGSERKKNNKEKDKKAPEPIGEEENEHGGLPSRNLKKNLGCGG